MTTDTQDEPQATTTGKAQDKADNIDTSASQARPLMSRGAAIRTTIMLVLISFLVGVVLDVIGMDPVDVWRGLAEGVRNVFTAIFSLGWETVSKVLGYVLFGAVIVVPVWLLITLLNLRNRRR